MARNNGWDSYQKLVLDKLENHAEHLGMLEEEIRSIRTEDIPELKIEIAMLKVKAGAWGAIAGMIPSLAALFYVWFRNK